MNQLLIISILLSLLSSSHAQLSGKTNIYNSKEQEKKLSDYGPWLFIQSDKALQSRYKIVKEENGISYFKVQFRINFDDPIFCNDVTCEGYLIDYSYPSLDNQTNIHTSYKFYNSFKGVFTREELISIKMHFRPVAGLLACDSTLLIL